MEARMTSTGPETHSNHAIGIDVSKDHLDAFCNHRASGSRFTNTAEGHKDLLTWARPTATTRFAFEPTGAYHIGLETTLGREGHLICKINPHRASLFAKASGRPAKTDQLDARGLAHMAAMDLVQPGPAVSENARALRELETVLASLIADAAALKTRLQTLTLARLKRLAKTRLTLLERQIGEVESELCRYLSQDATMKRRVDILRSVPGIADRTATRLALFMPELGDLTNSQIASLSGTAPRTRQSGQWSGKAFVHGGRSHVRKCLYMPAIVALRCNPTMKAIYTRLRDAGKPPKLAIMAIMRKLIILANALIRDDRLWTQKRP